MEEDGKCGLWSTTSKKGVKYYKGKMKLNGERYYVSLLLGNKRYDNSPDFNLIITKAFVNNQPQEEKKEEPSETYQPLTFNEPSKNATNTSDFERISTPNVYMEDFNLSEEDLPF